MAATSAGAQGARTRPVWVTLADAVSASLVWRPPLVWCATGVPVRVDSVDSVSDSSLGSPAAAPLVLSRHFAMAP